MNVTGAFSMLHHVAEIAADIQFAPLDELRNEFQQFWEEYADRPFTARNLILASFCPQVL